MSLATRLLALVVLALATPAAALAAAQESEHAGHAEHAAPVERTQPWSERTLELATSLPVQDGGRIKPLGTYAGFTLLRLNGKRSVKLEDDVKLTPVEWLLDVLFYPEQAAHYQVFVVQNSEVIDAIGLEHEDKKKRDRYTFEELRAGIPRLFELAHEYGSIEAKDRSSVQQQIWNLANNINAYLQLDRHMEFTRHELPLGASAALTKIFGERESIDFHAVVEQAGALIQAYNSEGASPADRQAIADLVSAAQQLAGSSHLLAYVPPAASVDEAPEWMSPSDLLMVSLQGDTATPEQVALLTSLETISQLRGDPAAMEAGFERLRADVDRLAGARGEIDKIDLEVRYYGLGLITNSLVLFILAFLLMAFMWLRPKNRFLHVTTSGVVLVATGLLTGAIVMRCMIRGRPPVSTLYETVLFVTAVGCMVALVAEWINRQRLAISAAAILGMVGLFIANGYETLDKQDTMPSLVAVLDTNFWLATHVTSITVGYSAGMLAALLATIYIVAKTLRVRRDDRAFYKSLARMVYGVLAFALIFSVVGTILGGIWANYSWGRFWGWDPKENGALLICLSQIAILHGRMGGYLKDLGLCMAAAFAGTIVAFSWWGVNLLGVGLHSYGFTSGIHTVLWTYYGLQWGVVGLGGVTWLLDRRTQPGHTSGAVVDTRSRKQGSGRGHDEPSPVLQSRQQDGLAQET